MAGHNGKQVTPFQVHEPEKAAQLILIAGASLADWDSSMSKNSRARATAKMAASLSSPISKPDTFWDRPGILLAGGIVFLAALAAYHNSLSGPFILDDHGAITENASIKELGKAWLPPPAATTGGRPLLNLTFALNYALGGMKVGGYHAFNLLVHMLAGLTLFGFVRRTLREHPTSSFAPFDGFDRLTAGKPGAMENRSNTQPPTSKSNRSIFPKKTFAEDATPLALAVAALWVVHPLQTEAVTYISQRAESLMGLFYLLTLYCFVRSAENQRAESRRQKADAKVQIQENEIQKPSDFCPLSSALWLLASVLACLLGAMTKEIIATAPVMVLLYDRTFVAGSFREAWRQRWQYYLGLSSTWLLLAGVLTTEHQRGVGFNHGVTWWNYAQSSCRSVMLYLKLALWPHPLVFDYGLGVAGQTAMVLLCALALAILVAGTAIALWRWPAVGFAGAWFFVILAPTSSVVPIAGQPVAESRMYLPLAAAIGLAVLGLYRWIGRRSLVLFAVVAVGLGWLTVRRNEDYRSVLSIWADTVAKRPDNARAHNAMGMALAEIPGEQPEAISHFETALHLKPDFAEAQSNLGMALSAIPGQMPKAIAHFEAALRINPDFAIAHNNLGAALANIPGRMPEAISHFQAALRLNPDYADARENLAAALAETRQRAPQEISPH
jgi:hypothetical protein